MTDKRVQGKNNRARGKAFERKVRIELEKKGWIVDRWTNQVEFGNTNNSLNKFMPCEPKLKNGNYYPGAIARLVPCKPNFNPFTKSMMMNSGGFPDFIAFRKSLNQDGYYEIIGVECKGGDEKHKYLDTEEKMKCIWYLENKIFNGIMIAQKGLKRGEIILKEF